jgi:hypothetical protein
VKTNDLSVAPDFAVDFFDSVAMAVMARACWVGCSWR